ncbi:MAG: glycine betaine ABC transporter substrate-binding protein [Peptostreptococcales bacterium]
MKMKRIIVLCIALVLIAGLLAGCTSPQTENGDPSAGDKGTVKIGYVNWVDVIALTNLATIVLEDTMGYEVQPILADLAPIYASIASGETDAYLGTWLPLTHAAQMDRYKDELENLGLVYEEGVMGLTVPAYMAIDSIEDLVGNEDIVNGEIVGIDAGAGMMGITEDAIKEYGLNMKLLKGSDVTMTALLDQAIKNNEPIVVTGWKPHWKFARYDLKILEDSKGIFGGEEKAYNIVRLGLSEDMPEVTEFLTKMYLTIDQLQEIIYMMESSEEDAKTVVRNWIKENADTVSKWLPEGYTLKVE